MKRPTWVTVVGVLMIIFGVFGILGSGQLMFMPKMVEFQKSIMEPALERAQQKDPQAERILEEFHKLLNMTDGQKQLLMFMGLISLFVCAFYLFAGINMIQFKDNFAKLAYWALGLSIGFTLLQVMFAVTSDMLFFMFMMIGAVFSLTIDLILLIVIILNDKKATAPDPVMPA
ncbi:MAG: hypothetical protein DWP97_10010 [Calditrichaeota bacterium]|nr:MAG: hypothetical protein DWP97_10010 [Calditrichota bacterium]